MGLSMGTSVTEWLEKLLPPEYLELRNAVLIAGPKDRDGLEGRGLQTPLVRDRGLYLGGAAGKGAIKCFVADFP